MSLLKSIGIKIKKFKINIHIKYILYVPRAIYFFTEYVSIECYVDVYDINIFTTNEVYLFIFFFKSYISNNFI
jgi:hypothetical protein